MLKNRFEQPTQQSTETNSVPLGFLEQHTTPARERKKN
jgi:hypothetical protein